MEKELNVLRLKKEKDEYEFFYKKIEVKRGETLGLKIINSSQGRVISEEHIDTEGNRELLKKELVAYNRNQLKKHEEELEKKKAEILGNIKAIEKIGEKLL